MSSIIMRAIKEMYRYKDLYGDENIILALKKAFKAVAYTNKAIPGPGSPCRNSADVANDLKITKMIFHHNNEITALTNQGNLRFF